MPESSRRDDLRQSLLKYAGFILNRRPYFRGKLKEKLILRAQKLGFTDFFSVIDDLLIDLSKSGFLNDLYLAEAFVRRQLAKGYGQRLISYRLRALGVDSDIIAQSLRSEATLEAQRSAVAKYIKKSASVDKRKVLSKLYSRGFDSQVLNHLFDGDTIED